MNERSMGHIEVIAGAMFSGKSEELIRRLRRAVIAQQHIQVFKPAADTRSNQVASRDNRALDATAVSSSLAIRQKLDWRAKVIGIDEAQFFDGSLVPLVVEMADAGKRVIVAGLDMDYRGEPFGPVPNLMAVAEYVDKVHAICVRCGKPAQFSQRIAGGSEQVQVGDAESYEPRCRRCFQRPSTDQGHLELAAEDPDDSIETDELRDEAESEAQKIDRATAGVA